MLGLIPRRLGKRAAIWSARMFQCLLGLFRKRSEVFCKRQFLHVQYHALRRVQIASHFAAKVKLLSVGDLCQAEMRALARRCSFLKTNTV